MGKRISAFLFCLLFCFLSLSSFAAEFTPKIDCRSAILMEASTGKVLYEMNADEALPPASVTKIMTLLLICEAVDDRVISLDDMVSTSERAASMGGSQVYLKVGEELSVRDMVKCVVIASANDCAVALAEYLCGSESAFVDKMNARAKELGMENTHFENTNGLDDTATNHVTSARDIAIMSRALISHPWILEFSSTWLDSIRDGAFGLTNTNRLIRFYSGANGLKTGSTSKAKFCISATAKREDMQLIAVVMAAPTRDTRNEIAKSLLDFGFSNYCIYHADPVALQPLPVLRGQKTECALTVSPFSAILQKERAAKVEYETELSESLEAPIHAGDPVGEVVYSADGMEIGRAPVFASEDVAKISYSDLFFAILRKIVFESAK